MEAGEKGRSMKHQSYTMKEFLLSSHLEQMEFLMLSRGALQTAYAKECWSNQFLKFLKTVVCLSRTLFLQTLECNESGNGRGEKEGKEVEEKGGKKGDTPPEKEKGSSSKGLGKKMSGDLSPRQIDAKVLNVLCGVLEEWERAKLLFHYGKRVTDASFVSSPLAIVKDKGSTKKKVPKSKAKLLKEAPEKTDKKVTLALEDVKKEPKEWTPCSNQVQRSQSVTSADIFRSLGEVCEAVGNYLLEGPKKTDGKETLKLKEETTSCNQQLQRTQPLELGDRCLSGRVVEREVALDVKINKYSEDVKVNKKTETLFYLDESIRNPNVSVERDRGKNARKSLKQRPTLTPVLSSSSSSPSPSPSPSPPLPLPQPVSFSSHYHTPIVYSPPFPPPPPQPSVYSSLNLTPAVYSSPSPPAPKVPDATPEPSAPSGHVYVREHYRQGHEVKGHWRGDTWGNGYYRGHYRKK